MGIDLYKFVGKRVFLEVNARAYTGYVKEVRGSVVRFKDDKDKKMRVLNLGNKSFRIMQIKNEKEL